jgi:hypothetical protein
VLVQEVLELVCLFGQNIRQVLAGVLVVVFSLVIYNIYNMKILTFESFVNESYNKPRAGGKRRWSVKYKKSINCSNPKGFSQKQYCKRKRKGGKYKN